MNVLTVCFIGHRKIDDEEQLKIRLKKVLSCLISHGADTFLFGSKSDFNFICWNMVTEFQKRSPHLKRIKYNAPHEAAFVSKEERQQFEQLYSQLINKEVHYSDYEETVDCAKLHQANKNSYIMRNREMIDGSDICVFYYNKDYLPPRRKLSKKAVFDYQPKSGTAIAYAYAKHKNKQTINLYEK